jgi:hypothetical protein
MEEWPSWLKAAVLKSARWYYHARQINNLRYTVLHGNGVFWAVWHTFVQQNVQQHTWWFEPVECDRLRLGIGRSMLLPLH